MTIGYCLQELINQGQNHQIVVLYTFVQEFTKKSGALKVKTKIIRLRPKLH